MFSAQNSDLDFSISLRPEGWQLANVKVCRALGIAGVTPWVLV